MQNSLVQIRSICVLLFRRSLINLRSLDRCYRGLRWRHHSKFKWETENQHHSLEGGGGGVCSKWQEISAFHGLSHETTATCQHQQRQPSFKCNCNRLDLFNSASEGAAGSGRGIKVAPWLRLREPAEQKASLNKRTQRLLTSIEGGSESNRQGEGAQHNTKAESLQSCKCMQIWAITFCAKVSLRL